MDTRFDKRAGRLSLSNRGNRERNQFTLLVEKRGRRREKGDASTWMIRGRPAESFSSFTEKGADRFQHKKGGGDGSRYPRKGGERRRKLFDQSGKSAGEF